MAGTTTTIYACLFVLAAVVFQQKTTQSVYLTATIVFACLFVLVAVVLPALLSEVIGGWTRKYTSPVRFRASSIPDLSGRVALVTGANTGVGYVTALELARNGAEVIVAARSAAKGEAAVSRIEKEIAGAKVKFLQLDLSSLESVERFASDFLALKKPLHILVLNAGIMKSPGSFVVGKELQVGFETTSDGFESQIGTNYVGHFHLTMLLSGCIKESAPSRVVAVSSSVEEFSYEEGFRFDEWIPAGGKMPAAYEDGRAYAQSKLASILFAREFASVYDGTGVTAYSCHPGVITTELVRYLDANAREEAKGKSALGVWLEQAFGVFFSLAQFKPEDGALTQLHLATAPADTLVNGRFYHPIGRLTPPGHPRGNNAELQKKLWEETERQIAVARGK